jgi:PPOX class probable F420-dependent enzyme
VTEMLNDADRALLMGQNFAHFVTLDADGRPHVAPIWIDADDDGLIVVNTAEGRRKDHNVRRDPRVALSISPQDDPYSWLSIQGTVVSVEPGDEALAHIGALSRRYTGEDWAPVQGQVRVIYRIRPDVIVRSG